MIRVTVRAITVWMVNAVAARLPDDPVSSRLRAWFYYPLQFRCGAKPTIKAGCRINGFGLRAGRRVFINRHCYFDLSAVISLGSDVVIGHHCTFVTADHTIGASQRRAGHVTPAAVVVEDGAWIGARCLILPGVRIGQGAIVGAGSTVTRYVPPDCVVAGSPARLLRRLNDPPVTG